MNGTIKALRYLAEYAVVVVCGVIALYALMIDEGWASFFISKAVCVIFGTITYKLLIRWKLLPD
jgi:hypothetical protein